MIAELSRAPGVSQQPAGYNVGAAGAWEAVVASCGATVAVMLAEGDVDIGSSSGPELTPELLRRDDSPAVQPARQLASRSAGQPAGQPATGQLAAQPAAQPAAQLAAQPGVPPAVQPAALHERRPAPHRFA